MLNLKETVLLLGVFTDSLRDGLDIKYILHRLQIAFNKVGKGDVVKILKERILFSGSIAEGMSIILPENLVEALRSGEKLGNLDYVFQQLKELYETKIKISNGLRKAISYPIFNFVLLFIMFTGALLFYVPRLKQILRDIPPQKIPSATKALLFLSDVLKQNTVIYILVTGLVILGVYFLFKKFRFLFFKIPLIQRIMIHQENIMIYTLFSVFYTAGINIRKIFEMLISSAEGPMKQILKKVDVAIVNGNTISRAFEIAGADEEVVMYIEIGEITQKIEEAFKKIVQIEIEKLDRELNILLNVSKNVMLVVIGIFVIIFFGVTVLPIYDIIQ